ncbi:MAG TPA: hypothetical protein VF185_00215 [Patescibacteria group bacterium]
MTKQIALLLILGMSVCGVLFSGYLSYREIFGSGGCKSGSCKNKIMRVPVCVYGLIMYLVVFMLALLGTQALY